jgi:hypothetical protein
VETLRSKVREAETLRLDERRCGGRCCAVLAGGKKLMHDCRSMQERVTEAVRGHENLTTQLESLKVLVVLSFAAMWLTAVVARLNRASCWPI